jgi:GTP-binding protein
VCNLDASPYLGRLALCRVINGTLERGQRVAWCRIDGTIEHAKVTELFITEALERVPAQSAGPGDIVAVAGFEDIFIGETLADPDNPIALEPLHVDEPSLSMTIGINTSPAAGTEGKLLTARMIKDRLDKELVGNVSLRVLTTERPDAWEVQGRGELQLAILIETMRREGFELTVGKPQVVTKMVDGKLHEPVEHVTIDVHEEFVGAVTTLLATRKGTMIDMVNHGTGWVRLEWRIPARGLVGIRTDFMTETRGGGMMHTNFDGYEPWFGDIRLRQNGVLVADRRGPTTANALIDLESRGVLFVAPGTEVYEGMIVGENSRSDEMNVNPTKEKKLTNMRASGSDHTERITPATVFSLEQALEFIADDEAVEVTPKSVRLRKVHLDMATRARNRKKI